MNYNEAVEYIHNCSHTGGHAGSTRIGPLCEKLGFPQRKMKFVHIAGSSGKGSTAAMTEAVLRKAGFKTGLYMSPFVYDFRERLQINGTLPEGQLIADALESMIPALDEMKAEGRECTEFETLTALAFTLFARENCDFVVLECGIGGKGDCTNVIDPPLVAALGNVALDHTNMLGNTITEIATEKCGIIKRGSRVAAYCELHSEAQIVLDNTCASLDIIPHIESYKDVQNLDCTGEGSRFDYQNQHYELQLVGVHQVKNALNVIGICHELRACGVDLHPKLVAEALKDVKLAGRFEVIKKKPLCIVDGAHNPDKIGSVCKAIDDFFPNKKVIGVFGMQKKKDYMTALPEFAKRCSVLIATEPDFVKDALTTDEIYSIAKKYCDTVICCRNPKHAGALALGMSKPSNVVIACGSLYLVSDAAAGIKGK